VADRNGALARNVVPEIPDAAEWPVIRDEVIGLRLALGWTFRELSDEISRLVPGNGDVSYSTLHNLLVGHSEKPRDTTLYRIVNALPEMRRMRDKLLAGRK
jgi:hypothetical protein